MMNCRSVNNRSNVRIASVDGSAGSTLSRFFNIKASDGCWALGLLLRRGRFL